MRWSWGEETQFASEAYPKSEASGYDCSSPPRISSFVDELPEVLGIGEGFIFGEGELRAEEEIRECAFVKDTVDDDLFLGGFEVEAPVIRAKAVEFFSVTFDLSEAFIIEVLEIFFGDLEFIEEFKLFESAELRDFGSGDFVEDDLEHGVRLA